MWVQNQQMETTKTKKNSESTTNTIIHKRKKILQTKKKKDEIQAPFFFSNVQENLQITFEERIDDNFKSCQMTDFFCQQKEERLTKNRLEISAEDKEEKWRKA